MFRWFSTIVDALQDVVGSLVSRVKNLFFRDDEEEEIRDEEDGEEEDEEEEDEEDEEEEEEEEEEEWSGEWDHVDDLPPSSLRGPFPSASDAEAYASEIPVFTRVVPRFDGGGVVDWYVYVEGS